MSKKGAPRPKHSTMSKKLVDRKVIREGQQRRRTRHVFSDEQLAQVIRGQRPIQKSNVMRQ